MLPGFGVAGIAGVTCSVGALVLIMLNNDFFDFSFVDPAELTTAVITATAGLFGALVLIFVGGSKLANSRFFNRVALVSTQESSEGYTANFKEETYVGKTGTAYSPLRPSGKIMIDGNVHDAYTRGDYIAKDSTVVVINDQGVSLLVKEQPQATEAADESNQQGLTS